MNNRILVTGSREWTDFQAIVNALRGGRAPGAVLVHGGTKGADRLAASIWRAWGLSTEEHCADWNRHGRAAGFVRNQHMVTAGADVCLAFILNDSPGATHCADTAEAAGIPTYRYRINTTPTTTGDQLGEGRGEGQGTRGLPRTNHERTSQ